jgi:hypothetical protein
MKRALAIAVLLLFAPALRATVLVPAEFREVVEGSHIIVHGRVVGVRAAWTADRRRIESTVTVQAATYLKGGPGETVTFRVPGGEIGRYKTFTVGAPEFRVGEEAILFLRAQGPGVASVFGFNQGVFRVRTDARTGARTVVPPAMLAAGVESMIVKRGAPERKPLAIETFATQVRAAMTTGGAR